MDASLSVSLSSQLALDRRLTTIADNVANMSTVGFRATEVKFNQELLNSKTASVAFVSPGNEYLSAAKGGLDPTGNPFDFAIKGDAWFSIQTPAGETLTRDGRFNLTQNGDLVTIEGYPVLDAGGGPIQLNPNNGPPSVSQDGVLYQGANRVASIGLYSADISHGYVRVGNSGMIPSKPATPLVDRIDAGVVQGYVEDSNVNALSEMTNLIEVQRAFDSMAASIKQSEGSYDDAIRTLGEPK